ncbi:hypothetical protein EAF04_007999 [Neofusicoccum parvum]|uniref:Uncharacterized protein n=1 Tax=Neofusicoccum parvum TaxID=310453 RepID=A0ACB5RUL1_9PEZI|nr:hypothetical protein EAF04_007999 [Neofusicoccum parvum]
MDSSEKLQPPSPADRRYLRSWRLVVVIASLCLGTFLVALDINIIGTAVPRITSDFDSLNDLAWYGSAYLLAVTALQPALGTVYKFFDVKATYLTSIVLFEAGSIVCAAAPNSTSFIVGRAVAGIGAAGLFQGALGIIGYTVALEKRPLYMGVVISVFGISVCVGPVLGGVLTDHASWRWCFWINVPIGVVTLVLIFFTLTLEQSNELSRALPLRDRLRHLDALGVISFVGAICCLLLALQWGGQTLPWHSSRVIGLFVGFGILFIIFWYLQWKRDEYATIPLRVLRQRSILMGSCYLLILGMSSFAYNFFIPIFFQSAQGVSATTSGVRFIALIVPQVVFVIITGAVATKYGYYVPYIILGTTVAIVGCGLITTINIDTPTIKWASFLALNGVGMGTAMQLPYTAVQVVLSDKDIPTGNALFVFAWQLGGALALSVCQSLLVSNLTSEIPRRIPSISPQAVIQVGAANLDILTSDAGMLRQLRGAYAGAVRHTFIFALVAAAVSLPFACGMEWLKIKLAPKKDDLSESSEEEVV